MERAFFYVGGYRRVNNVQHIEMVCRQQDNKEESHVSALAPAVVPPRGLGKKITLTFLSSHKNNVMSGIRTMDRAA